MNFAECMEKLVYKPKSWKTDNSYLLALKADDWERLGSLDCIGGHICLSSYQPLIARVGHEFVDVHASHISTVNDGMLPCCSSISEYRIAYELPRSLMLPWADTSIKSIHEILLKIDKVFFGLGCLWYVPPITKKSVILRPVIPMKRCIACSGSGNYPDGPFCICPFCTGTGVIDQRQWDTLGHQWGPYLESRLRKVNSVLGAEHAYVT